MRRHNWQEQAVNLGADTPFFETNKTAIIVVGGVLAIAVAAAFAVHHAKAKKHVSKNPYMPGHVSDYIKTQVKMLPHHLAYARGANGTVILHAQYLSSVLPQKTLTVEWQVS